MMPQVLILVSSGVLIDHFQQNLKYCIMNYYSGQKFQEAISNVQTHNSITQKLNF